MRSGDKDGRGVVRQRGVEFNGTHDELYIQEQRELDNKYERKRGQGWNHSEKK